MDDETKDKNNIIFSFDPDPLISKRSEMGRKKNMVVYNIPKGEKHFIAKERST